MAARTRLSDAEIESKVAAHPDWTRDGDRLRRTFRFGSFVEAFGWMAAVALVAEKLDHHPEWRNVYDRVEVALSTHDAGGITALDFRLAGEMDRLSAAWSRAGG